MLLVFDAFGVVSRFKVLPSWTSVWMSPPDSADLLMWAMNDRSISSASTGNCWR